jgi:Mrp family chromosome partitioning ATPase
MAVTNDSTTRTSVATPPARLPATLITVPDCPPDVVEAYDTLLTNVDIALGANAGGMVAVAALDDSADAPVVAANLALVAARSGERTLLVDCDLEHAGLNQLFGLDTTPGLAQLLGGEHHELSTLAQSTTLPLLGVIASGARGARHNRLARHGDVPAALLRLKNAADRVVLAAPPVLTSTDVLRLGPYVDGVVLVVTAGRTQREAAARARTILDRGEVTLLGVVLQ